MRILFLSFYFSPDFGPGPIRAKSIADEINERLPDNAGLKVISTQPSRYIHSNKIDWKKKSQTTYEVVRIQLPGHKNKMYMEAFSFLLFAKEVLRQTRNHEFDVVVATSSRLLTGVLAAIVAKRCRAKLYVDIRDLFVEAISDTVLATIGFAVRPLLAGMEKYLYRSANMINVVSEAFIPRIKSIAPKVKVTCFRNGIDEEFLNAEFDKPVRDDRPVVLYAGNIGAGQALQKIIPCIAKDTENSVYYKIIGDGRKRNELIRKVNDLNLTNVEVLEPVAREDLIAHYRQADILFLHSDACKSFLKVIPSKLFEYSVTNKPILAGLGGHSASILINEIPGSAVFSPCNTKEMKSALDRLLKETKPINRSRFIERNMRKKIVAQIATDIFDLVK